MPEEMLLYLVVMLLCYMTVTWRRVWQILGNRLPRHLDNLLWCLEF